jgi:hypothetical protein
LRTRRNIGSAGSKLTMGQYTNGQSDGHVYTIRLFLLTISVGRIVVRMVQAIAVHNVFRHATQNLKIRSYISILIRRFQKRVSAEGGVDGHLVKD